MTENNEEQVINGSDMLYHGLLEAIPDGEEKSSGMPLQLQFHTVFTLSLLVALRIFLRTVFNRPVAYMGNLYVSKEGISLDGTLGYF